MLIRKTTRNAIHMHRVEISVIDGPMLDSHSYYSPGLMYTPELLVLEWLEGEEPKSIEIIGKTTDNTAIKRSYGVKQAPEWLRQAVVESITEAKDWQWQW